MERENWTLEKQAHKMRAEGKQVDKPTSEDIRDAVKSEGYEAVNIDVSFDEMMKLWSWVCNIRPI